MKIRFPTRRVIGYEPTGNGAFDSIFLFVELITSKSTEFDA
jgi:hypothetical protein